MKKFRIGVIGATGKVGRTFLSLLSSHPWFEITLLCASERSAGLNLKDRLTLTPDEEPFANFILADLKNISSWKDKVDFVFCATNSSASDTIKLETELARLDIPVISNHSAHRFTPDVPLIIPEINPEHLELIPYQRKRLGVKRGFIAVKSNCALQSFLPLLVPLKKYFPSNVSVCTMQAVSGAGKRLEEVPSLQGNIFPYIDGEEEKLQSEPLKILGKYKKGKVRLEDKIAFSAQCFRVPVEYGHTVAINVSFRKKPSEEDILSAWKNFRPVTSLLSLPSAPKNFITYFTEKDRPQPKTDCQSEQGMGVCVGNLRKDGVFDYKFTGLSHNLIRGAAGGAILLAELLAVKGYLD
ncbi:MAG: aspartate-semialdehyde dehydrogenase [Clostridia bacterium]|nr:aspartate-semialdehyde dehydrogenase [Clostridia bacterium]